MTFTNDSVDSILSTFNKTIDKLKALQTKKISEAQSKLEEAKVLQIQAEAANKEAEKADNIITKLSTLIS